MTGTPGGRPRLQVRTSLTTLLVFLLMAATLFSRDDDPFPKIVGLLLVVVVHEVGHATVALWLGGSATVGLNALGGHTITPEVGLFSRPRRALLAVAGPGLGLGVAGLAWVAVRGTTPGSAGWSFLTWFLLASVVINLANLLPLPGLDGAHLLELVFNERGRPGRRAVVTVISGATAVAALGWAWSLGSPVLALVVLVTAVPGFQARLARPDARFRAIEQAALSKDADRLFELAAAEGGAADLRGTLLAAAARRDAAVLRAAEGRLDEARSLLVGSAAVAGPSGLVVELLGDERGGAVSLARWVAERRGRSVPPALLAAPDSTQRLLAVATGGAADLPLLDHHTLAQILTDARRWNEADAVAEQLWHRGYGPDAAILRALIRGGMVDHDGAVTWLLAARQAGGDVRPWAAHAAELAAVRGDQRVRTLATFP